MYWNYYQQNRWKLYNRTKTADFVKTDLATWDAEDFHKKIGELYLQSIKNEKVLQKTKLDPLDAIITKVAEPKVEYKIRLSTLRDPKLFNGSKVKQYGLVEEVLTGNLVTFYLSGFENKEEAKEVIDNVKESGFPAAQIVKLMNGEYSIDN